MGAGLLAAGCWRWWCPWSRATPALALVVAPPARRQWRIADHLLALRTTQGGRPARRPWCCLPCLPPPAETQASWRPSCFYALAPFFLVFAVYQQAGLGHGALGCGVGDPAAGDRLPPRPLCSPHLASGLGARTAAFGHGPEVMGLLLAAALAGLPSWLPVPLLLIGLGQGIALPALVRGERGPGGTEPGRTRRRLDEMPPCRSAPPWRWRSLAACFFALAPMVLAEESADRLFRCRPDDGRALALAAVLSWPSAPATATRGACDAD